MIRVTYTTQIDCYNDKVTVDSPGTVDELELKANKVVKLGEKDTNYRSKSSESELYTKALSCLVVQNYVTILNFVLIRSVR